MEEVRARIGFMKELKELGHSTEEIEKFLGEQFARGEGSSKDHPTDGQESNDEDESSSVDISGVEE